MLWTLLPAPDARSMLSLPRDGHSSCLRSSWFMASTRSFRSSLAFISSELEGGRTPQLDVEDWDTLAAQLEISVEEILDHPIGDLPSVLIRMEEDGALVEAGMERAYVVLDAWADTYQTDAGSIRPYRYDPTVFGHVSAGAVAGRKELADLLSRWTADDPAETIGATGPRAHITIEMGEVDLYLAADTTLSAVRRFLVHCDTSGTDEPWYVIPNRNGVVSKVSFEEKPVPGWYCYLKEPWGAPGRL